MEILMLYSIVAILVVILDQAVKYWVTNTLFGNDIVKFIPGVVSLVNVHNTGAAFGFLSGGGARIYFIVITVVFVLLVIIALATNFISGRVSRWAIVLVAAGGFANCIDRVIYGYVVDMFKVELFEFAVFNVADIFVTVFAIVFALAMIFERQDTDDEDEFYDEDEDDEDEEDAPKRERKPLFSRARKNRDIDEDDDEDEPPVQQPARRPRKTNYAQEYEQYKAERAARERANGAAAPAAPSRPAARVDNANNPFAEWEQANERAASQRSGSYAAKAMGTNAPDYSRPAAQNRPTTAAPAPRPTTSVKPSAPVQQPAAPKPQQAAPAPKKQEAKPSSSTEFDLDDILAEFK